MKKAFEIILDGKKRLESIKHRFSNQKFGMHETKKSCHWQDPFQNINPNITLEIKSFRLIIENSA